MFGATKPMNKAQRLKAQLARYLDELLIERFDWLRLTKSNEIRITLTKKESQDDKSK